MSCGLLRSFTAEGTDTGAADAFSSPLISDRNVSKRRFHSPLRNRSMFAVAEVQTPSGAPRPASIVCDFETMSR